jgi:hypothetical protein
MARTCYIAIDMDDMSMSPEEFVGTPFDAAGGSFCP